MWLFFNLSRARKGVVGNRIKEKYEYLRCSFNSLFVLVLDIRAVQDVEIICPQCDSSINELLVVLPKEFLDSAVRQSLTACCLAAVGQIRERAERMLQFQMQESASSSKASSKSVAVDDVEGVVPIEDYESKNRDSISSTGSSIVPFSWAKNMANQVRIKI